MLHMTLRFWLCGLVTASAATSTLGQTPPSKNAPTDDATVSGKDKTPVPGARIRKKTDPKLTPITGLKKIALASGVQHWDIKVGDGKSPTPGDRVVAHYSAWLKDGTLFDTTAGRARPSRFDLRTIVPGFAEGIISMKIGGKRRIEVPPEHGYGPKGATPRVPPNATLVYEVELLDVLEPVEPPTPTDPGDAKRIITESGLAYWDLKVGTGKSPTVESVVSVHYSGWLAAEGARLFHTSLENERPETFRLNKVIPGMTEGILSMKVGGKRRLVVPPELGYGVDGLGQHVPGGSTLIFEVDLVDVMPPPQAPTQTKLADTKPVVTRSGLKYWDIKVGDGDSPDGVSTITMHYAGWLKDGTLFDSSIERGQPLRGKPSKMLKGVHEGVKSMKVGGKRRLEIPGKLGYGEEGSPPIVPPNATLIYEVELLDVEY